MQQALRELVPIRDANAYEPSEIIARTVGSHEQNVLWLMIIYLSYSYIVSSTWLTHKLALKLCLREALATFKRMVASVIALIF